MAIDARKAHFVSERIKVDAEEMDASHAAPGAPALPVRFWWGDEEIEVGEVVDTWKGHGPCTHNSGEKYLRRHYYKVRVTDGRLMSLYFERKAPGRPVVTAKGRKPISRWYLHSWEEAE